MFMKFECRKPRDRKLSDSRTEMVHFCDACKTEHPHADSGKEMSFSPSPCRFWDTKCHFQPPPCRFWCILDHPKLVLVQKWHSRPPLSSGVNPLLIIPHVEFRAIQTSENQTCPRSPTMRSYIMTTLATMRPFVSQGTKTFQIVLSTSAFGFGSSEIQWRFGVPGVSMVMYRGTCPESPKLTRPQRLKGITLVVCLTRGRSLRSDVWLGVTTSRIPNCRKAYHIPKALVRTSTKATLSSSHMMAEY